MLDPTPGSRSHFLAHFSGFVHRLSRINCSRMNLGLILWWNRDIKNRCDDLYKKIITIIININHIKLFSQAEKLSYKIKFGYSIQNLE